jgi:hypothetical protein
MSSGDVGWEQESRSVTRSGGKGAIINSQLKIITYSSDPSGRRIEKIPPRADLSGIDDQVAIVYCHHGDHVIGEYDGDGNLLRKYIYGPRVDEPICMIRIRE